MPKQIYDWKLISKDYENGLSFKELNKKYGVSSGAIQKAKKRGDIKTRSISDSLKNHYKLNPKKLKTFNKNRICKICKIEKDLNLFRVCNKGKQHYRRWTCFSCERITLEKQRQKYKNDFINFKKTLKCNRCGYSDYRALQFHHLSKNKEFQISSKIGQRSLNGLKSEIEKCEILCANCHQIEHYLH